MLSSQQFGDLAGELHTKGGFSVNVHTGERPQSGYMVSDLRGEKKMPLSEVQGSDIESYARQKKGKRLMGPHRFLGGWANQEDANAYLDRSTHYPDTPWGQSKAYVRMVSNNQKAAFDVGRSREIPNPAYEGDVRKRMARMQGQNVP
jgi:hypothetical protein